MPAAPRHRLFALTGLVFVLQAGFFTLLTLGLAPALRDARLLNTGDLLLGCGALALVGAGLSLAGLRHPAGKAAAVLGLLLLVLLLQLR